MKKVISVILAMLLAFSALAVCAAAGDYQTYYMAYDVDDSTIHITPIEGYSQYVLPGEDFRFTIEMDEGYSDTFVIVQVDGVDIDPDVHGVYIISDINSDKTIKAFVSVEDDQSNLFASLIVLVHNIMAWFKNIIETIMKSIQT